MAATAGRRLDVEYVMPLRWRDDSELAGLTDYLHYLSGRVDVTVVDGSDKEIFARHDGLWSPMVRHLRPEPWSGRNGKVAGVVTGVRLARHERVVIADDDVRWDFDRLAQATNLLDSFDLVRPQNVFDPLPWHARWDTGRSLINRALGADYPGTYALRRSTFVAMGGYDGDVLFENLEMARTLRAAGGLEVCASDIFVTRRPPTAQHFRGQRVRQAYDDLAQPPRLVAECAVLPVLLWMVTRRRAAPGLLGGAAAVVGLAEVGRRRHGGRAVYPSDAALWAPLWLLERAVSVWVALAWRAAGGVPYAGERLKTAAHSLRQLRRSPRQPLRAEDLAETRH